MITDIKTGPLFGGRSKDIKIRWGSLKGMYIYTIIGAGGFGLGILETTDEKGVKIGGKDMQAIEERLERSDKMLLYDITITPVMVF